MSWLDKLRAFFQKNPALPDYPSETSLIISEPANQTLALSEHSTRMADEIPDDLPHWLSSEETLRDEGVIYGLSGTDVTEKVNIIFSTYKKRTANLYQRKEELTEKIGELNLVLEKKNGLQEELKQKSLDVLLQTESEENIARVIVGLLLALGMSAANYFLIKEGVSYGFPESSKWISWGVFLTGMFSLYYTTSFIHNSDKITWRRALEEFGMPLAASIFIYVQLIPHMAWYKSLAYLVFTFFIFLISGKLLLGCISKLKSEMSAYYRNRNLKKDKISAKNEWIDDIEDLEKDMENIRLEKWRIITSLNEVQAKIDRINSEKEAVTNLFLSEYNLAKNYKDKLNSSQISKILK